MKIQNSNNSHLNEVEFNEINFIGGTSRYYVDKNLNFFVKKPILFLDHDILKREVYIYKLLNSLNILWCPKLIYYNNELIVTEYKGEVINEINIPSDYKNQISIILKDLKSLDIKHNDILKGNLVNKEIYSEILVNNGKLYLIDYGWATIKDDFSLGQNYISNKLKPAGIVNDQNIISYLDDLYKKKCNNTPVRNRRNDKGSQIEVPIFEMLNEKTIKIGGYQNFEISKDNLILHSKKNKYNIINDIIKNLHYKQNCFTLADIGCSAGVLCYLANNIGYEQIYGLDHDKEYINLMSKINQTLQIDKVTPQFFSFGDYIPQSDVVIMCALIHWVYSCTSLYGNFASIFKYLRTSVKKYLLIEWVDPSDGAIQYFNHIDYNKDKQSERYNKENFEKQIVNFIGPILDIKYLEGARFLYLIKKL